MRYSREEFVPVFKALGDETRLKILEMLSCGELCACKIIEEFSITQPTLSYHMKTLTESGLVNARKDGIWMRYSINAERAEMAKDFLNWVTTERPDCICKNNEEK